ncbi:MAG TPA: rhodanese-like domain-containing protein [Eudoraea sp.]|nr:rhodanese-like domain-containing protein [Eudoraea sp.]
MKVFPCIVLALLPFSQVHAQKTMEGTLEKFNSESVPYISVDTLAAKNDMALLDARKKEEFEVSHLNGAFWVGYRDFSLDRVLVKFPDKSTGIVVYCSVGVRSEKIGEQLIRAGYSNVKNLYGGIFEWKNHGYPVYDKAGTETNRVHAFSKKWGKLLTKGVKVYDKKEPDDP